MHGLLKDLKHALRVLRKAPAFTLAAVAILGLGVGANTAIFSVVYGVLLRPLPFDKPEQLVQLWHTPPQKSFPGIDTFSLSAANYLDWERQNEVFEKSAIYEYTDFHLGTTDVQVLDSARVQASFFSVLGVRPLLGRAFAVGDDAPGAAKIVVLSHRLWRSRFGSDPSIVGRSIQLNRQSYEVVGVMPETVAIPDWASLWTPLVWMPGEKEVRGEHHYMAIARLKPGVSLQQARANLSQIAGRLAEEYPADNAGWGAKVITLNEQIVGEAREPLLVLFGAVAFVLLIACANVGNLMLAKTLDRRKEIAIRTALGASRARIIREVLAESFWLSIAGGVLGLLIANFGTAFIVQYLGSKLPRLGEIGVDHWVLLFTFALSTLTGIAAGVIPAWKLSSADPNDAMKQTVGKTDSSTRGMKTRSALVMLEVALSVVLLVGAGLMIRTLWNLRDVNPGFDPRQVTTMTIAVARTDYSSAQQEIGFFRDLLTRVRALPGVDSAGLIDTLPLSGGGSMQPIAIEGRPVVAMADQPEVAVRRTGPGYMKAMRIPILRGRDFADSDDAAAPGAILISESLAKRFWPGEDALGKRLTMTFIPERVRQVVGIVGDVKNYELGSKEPEPTLYLPVAQIFGAPNEPFEAYAMTLVVRAAGETSGPVSAVTTAVNEVKPGTPVLDIQGMEHRVAESIVPQRFNMMLLGAFAVLALMLAAVGIYSVLAYAVRQRAREMGIRMALGAQGRDVLRLVLLDGLKPTLLGLGVGLVAALGLGRVVSALVYGVRTFDAGTFALAAVVLVAVGLLASLLPAYRATRVDPLETLRQE